MLGLKKFTLKNMLIFLFIKKTVILKFIYESIIKNYTTLFLEFSIILWFYKNSCCHIYILSFRILDFFFKENYSVKFFFLLNIHMFLILLYTTKNVGCFHFCCHFLNQSIELSFLSSLNEAFLVSSIK